MRWREFIYIAVALAGCQSLSGRSTGPQAVFDGMFPAGRRTEAIRTLVASDGLVEDEYFKLIEIGRDANSSHHLAWIRDRETLHRHDKHDLLIFILEGHGSMLLGDAEQPVGEGSIVYIPRGTVHSYRNQSAEPSVAYGVFVPPFDGKDRVHVNPASAPSGP